MNLKELSIKCGRTIFLYQNRMSKISTAIMRKELVNNIVEINKEINSDMIVKSLEQVKENFNILLYSIIFKEELIDNEIILKSLNNNVIGDRSLSLLIDSILTMKKELTNEIVSKILNKNFKSYLKVPYDYRFHILKRREISKDIKYEILKTYSDSEIEEMLDIITSDLEEVYNIYGKRNLMKLDEFKNILDEQYVYYILKEYQANFKNKKTSM